MARDTFTPVVAGGPYPTLQPTAASLDFALVAINATNKCQVALTGKELLLVQNTGAGARTFTVSSVADALKRSGDITAYSLGAGKFMVLGPFAIEGWRQSDGNLYFEGEHAEIKVTVIRLP